MYIIEKITCPQCAGNRKIRLQDREFAICGVCSGKGYIQKYQKQTAAQLLGMIWAEDNTGEVKYAVNSGEGGNQNQQNREINRKGAIKKS